MTKNTIRETRISMYRKQVDELFRFYEVVPNKHLPVKLREPHIDKFYRKFWEQKITNKKH